MCRAAGSTVRAGGEGAFTSAANVAAGTGTYHVAGAGAGGYAALGGGERTSMDVADGYGYAPVQAHDQDDLGRPHAPFMGDADRASWQPAAGGGVYRNSAAAAMSGSTAALAGGEHAPFVRCFI